MSFKYQKLLKIGTSMGISNLTLINNNYLTIFGGEK